MTNFDEYQASAAVAVESIVVGPATLVVREWMVFRAYHVRATSPAGMQLSSRFRATVKGFNEAYGFNCRNWAEVAEVTKAVYAERDRAARAARESGQ